jgi:hypothetical protein
MRVPESAEAALVRRAGVSSKLVDVLNRHSGLPADREVAGHVGIRPRQRYLRQGEGDLHCRVQLQGNALEHLDSHVCGAES